MASALRVDFGEESFYFCSRHRLHAFEVNPDDYLSRARLTAHGAKAAGLPVHR
jgi:YHS domain-containing protein